MGTMEISGNAREVCRYATEKFDRLITAHGINSLRRTFCLLDGRNDVVHMKDLLRGQAAL